MAEAEQNSDQESGFLEDLDDDRKDLLQQMTDTSTSWQDDLRDILVTAEAELEQANFSAHHEETTEYLTPIESQLEAPSDYSVDYTDLLEAEEIASDELNVESYEDFQASDTSSDIDIDDAADEVQYSLTPDNFSLEAATSSNLSGVEPVASETEIETGFEYQAFALDTSSTEEQLKHLISSMEILWQEFVQLWPAEQEQPLIVNRLKKLWELLKRAAFDGYISSPQISQIMTDFSNVQDVDTAEVVYDHFSNILQNASDTTSIPHNTDHLFTESSYRDGLDGLEMEDVLDNDIDQNVDFNTAGIDEEIESASDWELNHTGTNHEITDGQEDVSPQFAAEDYTTEDYDSDYVGEFDSSGVNTTPAVESDYQQHEYHNQELDYPHEIDQYTNPELNDPLPIGGQEDLDSRIWDVDIQQDETVESEIEADDDTSISEVDKEVWKILNIAQAEVNQLDNQESSAEYQVDDSSITPVHTPYVDAISPSPTASLKSTVTAVPATGPSLTSSNINSSTDLTSSSGSRFMMGLVAGVLLLVGVVYMLISKTDPEQKSTSTAYAKYRASTTVSTMPEKSSFSSETTSHFAQPEVKSRQSFDSPLASDIDTVDTSQTSYVDEIDDKIDGDEVDIELSTPPAADTALFSDQAASADLSDSSDYSTDKRVIDREAMQSLLELTARVERLERTVLQLQDRLQQQGESGGSGLIEAVTMEELAQLFDSPLLQTLQNEKRLNSLSKSLDSVERAIEKGQALPRKSIQKRKQRQATVKAAEKQKYVWSLNLISIYSELSVAETEAKVIRDAGIPAEITKHTLKGKQWYRIRIPGFKSLDEAIKFKPTVSKKLGKTKYWIGQSKL